MAKTTNLYVRLEPGFKEQADLVLGQLGISDLTEIELNEELEKGYSDFTQGNTKDAEKVFSDIRRDCVYEIQNCINKTS